MPTKKKAPKKEYGKMSETEHAKEFHKWLDSVSLKHTHVGNESGQAGSRNIVIMMAKKKAMGVSKGFPDYCITVDFPLYSVNVFVELKKARGVRGGMNGSHVHKEQIEWCEALSKVPFAYVDFCHGWIEAKEFVAGVVDRNAGLTTSAGLDEWRMSARKDFSTEYSQYIQEGAS